jgi:hypothetical protein
MPPIEYTTTKSSSSTAGVHFISQLGSSEHRPAVWHTLCSFHLHWTFNLPAARPGRWSVRVSSSVLTSLWVNHIWCTMLDGAYQNLWYHRYYIRYLGYQIKHFTDVQYLTPEFFKVHVYFSSAHIHVRIYETDYVHFLVFHVHILVTSTLCS